MPTLRIHFRTHPLAAHQQFLCLRLGDQVQASFGDAPQDLCLTIPLAPGQSRQSLFGAFVRDGRDLPAHAAGAVVTATFELLPDPPSATPEGGGA